MIFTEVLRNKIYHWRQSDCCVEEISSKICETKYIFFILWTRIFALSFLEMKQMIEENFPFLLKVELHAINPINFLWPGSDKCFILCIFRRWSPPHLAFCLLCQFRSQNVTCYWEEWKIQRKNGGWTFIFFNVLY